MKIFCISIFLFFWLHSDSQTKKIADSTLEEMCKTLQTNPNNTLSDTDRIKDVFQKHITPLVSDLNETEQTDALQFVYFRLQRVCKEFKSILDRIDTNKGDWVSVDQKPVSHLHKDEYIEMLKIGKFYYKEFSGDTVQLTLGNNIWEDHFKDGTYSRLKLRWLKDAEFQIEFIESNNLIRKNYSKPGDKYNYQLLEKKDNKYKLSAEVVGTGRFVTFYLYFEHK